MRTTLLVTVALLVASGLAIWWWSRGPDASQFANLRAPRLTQLRDQTMLVVEAEGDPNVVAASAFKVLFITYYKLDGVSRFGRPPAPRARWPDPETTPKDRWLGQYALPVPNSAEAPPTMPKGGLQTVVRTWRYGDVAEVLHVGPYSTETPDIERLHQFIRAQGYRAVGEHEEECIKGPGMFFAGDPTRTLTIIRLRVDKTSGR